MLTDKTEDAKISAFQASIAVEGIFLLKCYINPYEIYVKHRDMISVLET